MLLSLVVVFFLFCLDKHVDSAVLHEPDQRHAVDVIWLDDDLDSLAEFLYALAEASLVLEVRVILQLFFDPGFIEEHVIHHLLGFLGV